MSNIVYPQRDINMSLSQEPVPEEQMQNHGGDPEYSVMPPFPIFSIY